MCVFKFTDEQTGCTCVCLTLPMNTMGVHLFVFNFTDEHKGCTFAVVF